MEEEKNFQPQTVKIWLVCGKTELRSLNLTSVIRLPNLRKQLSHSWSLSGEF